MTTSSPEITPLTIIVLHHKSVSAFPRVPNVDLDHITKRISNIYDRRVSTIQVLNRKFHTELNLSNPVRWKEFK